MIELTTDRQLIAARIRAARKSRGVTHSALSKRTGIPKGSIVSYERGTMKPSEERLAAIAAALDTSVGYLKGRVKFLFGEKVK